MDLKEKVIEVLRRAFEPDYIRLENDGGISGFVVSPRFRKVTALDRQAMIEQALRDGFGDEAPKALRRILAIAPLTPAEFEGTRGKIRVHRVKETAPGAVEILLYGPGADAEYVRGVLGKLKGVQTTEPKSPPRELGAVTSFRAKGSHEMPLTRARVIAALKKDDYIEVISDS